MTSQGLNRHDDHNLGTDAVRAANDSAESAFLASVYVGSIGGAIGGLVAAQSFVGGIYPVVFGALGCMAGSSFLCALSAWIWRRNSSSHSPQSSQDSAADPWMQPHASFQVGQDLH